MSGFVLLWSVEKEVNGIKSLHSGGCGLRHVFDFACCLYGLGDFFVGGASFEVKLVRGGLEVVYVDSSAFHACDVFGSGYHNEAFIHDIDYDAFFASFASCHFSAYSAYFYRGHAESPV
jgi:hypothetical protein